MADKPLWMPLNPADYLKDTRHLSTLEHGAYLLLLMTAWTAGGKLPADPVRLARIAGLTTEQWDECGAVVLAFFQPKGSGFEHKRIAVELIKAGRLIEQKREAGKASAKARAEKDKSNERSTGADIPLERQGNQSQSQGSFSKEKGASAPIDPAKVVFGEGVAMLTAAGDDPKKARSFLGGLRKQHGDSKVAEAIGQAQRLAINDPRPWLVAAMARAANDQSDFYASIGRTFGSKENVK